MSSMTSGLQCGASAMFSPRRRGMKTTVFTNSVPCNATFNKCAFKTARNTYCSNHAKVYNEDAKMWVCGIHDNMVKASGICVICLEPMGDPSERLRLACKHAYHKECASLLELPSCPTCRAPITGKYSKRLFHTTKTEPIMDKVYNLSPEKQKAFFELAETMLGILDYSNNSDEIRLFKSHISTFAYGLRVLKNIPNSSPFTAYGIMMDWNEAAGAAYTHLSERDSYAGLEFVTDGLNFFVENSVIYQPQPPVDNVVYTPTLPNVIQNAPFAETVPTSGQVANLSLPTYHTHNVSGDMLGDVSGGMLENEFSMSHGDNTFITPPPIITQFDNGVDDMELSPISPNYSPVSPSGIRL